MRRFSKAFPAGHPKDGPVIHPSDVDDFRNLPPDLVAITQAARASLLAAAILNGETERPTQADVARHEAGHVMGGALLGGRTRSCWIRQSQGEWAGMSIPRELPAWHGPKIGRLQMLTPQGCIARAVFCWSGPVAERQHGRGGGALNLATDFAELMDGCEALRIGVTMAMFPNAQPADDDDHDLIQHAGKVITDRLYGWLVAVQGRESERVEATAAKLLTHGRLLGRQLDWIMRGLTPISPSDLFDHLRQGLAVGPLPPNIPPAYLEGMQPPVLGSDVG